MNKSIFSMNSLSKYSELFQIIGVIGLIASLIFVGLELRQTQKIAIAGQQQARTILRTNQILSTYDFSPEEIGVENIPWSQQSDLQRYNREQRQVYYWTVNENNFYQYTQGMMDQVIWDKEKQYTELQWNHCHLRHVFEAQNFIKPFEDYVRSLPDLCNDKNNSDGLIKRFEQTELRIRVEKLGGTEWSEFLFDKDAAQTMKYKEIMWGRWILLAMVIYGVLQPREFIDFFSDGTGLFLAYAITFSVLTYAFVLFNDDYWTRGANLFVLFLLFFLCKFFFSENINEIINLYFFSDLTIYSILIVLISFYHLVMWSYRKK